MKVGDLVTKQSDSDGRLYGIVLEVVQNEWQSHIKVMWGAYGTFWCAMRTVELVNESR